MHGVTKIIVASALLVAALSHGEVNAQEGRLADDLLEDPRLNEESYFPLDDVDGVLRTASHENGVLTLTSEATEDIEFRNRLFLVENSDYLETTFTITNETVLGDEGRAAGQLEISLYNELADGGVDGRIGDVSALLIAEVRADGRSSVEYCLFRVIDADGNNEGGLADGEFCRFLPIRFEIGMPLRVAVSLDRNAGTVTFRANEFGAVEPVEGPIFNHSDQFTVISASPRDLATSVLSIDEIRNSSTALTDTEINAGATEPTPFPPIQTEATVEDSSIAFPFTISEPIDFVDDFSQPTALLSFDPDRRDNELSGEYGIAFIDNGLMIEAAEPGGDDCCSTGRLRVQDRTDFLSARVLISSDSRIPVEGRASSSIRIEGTWYNDTQDFGFDDRGGDVHVQSNIQINGNGAREASFCFSRDTGDGNNEDLNLFDGGNCGFFDVLPEFDTEYELSIALDREAATMTFTLDDESQVIDLVGPVFEAERSDRAVSVQHRGNSGRSVGSLFSITTDSTTIDFTNGETLIAPYRPHFSSQYEGREVAVVDGRLRLAIDSAVAEGNEPRFISRNPSEHVSANVEISSESRLDGGLVFIGVGGDMYNDIMDGGRGPNDSEGAVFGIVNMVMNDDGEDYFEYCAFRSNASDFSDATELLGTDGETCPRFTSVPELDTPVTLVLSVDRELGVMTFSAGDETAEFTITTERFIPHSFFNGLRVRASDGSQLISFADNLAFSADPVPLANSAAQLGFTGDLADLGVSDSSISSSGGGGCSISGGSSGLSAPLLMLLGLLIAKLRRLTRVKTTRRVNHRSR